MNPWVQHLVLSELTCWSPIRRGTAHRWPSPLSWLRGSKTFVPVDWALDKALG
jgi:hypothetical protein